MAILPEKEQEQVAISLSQLWVIVARLELLQGVAYGRHDTSQAEQYYDARYALMQAIEQLEAP